MSTAYTDLTTFERDVWPQGRTIERRFVETAADIAHNYINAALGVVYAVPFSSPYPPLIVNISDMLTRIIVEWVHDFGRLPKVDDVEQRAGLLSPVGMLREIVDGSAALLDTSGNLIARRASTGAYVSTSGQVPVFEQDHEFNHEVDPDRLDELETLRRG